MSTKPFWVVVAAASLAFAGCQKKSEAPPPASAGPKTVQADVVAERERSRHFLAVTRHLELGGTVYGYADIDGDAAKVAAGLGDIMGQVAATQPQAAPFLKQDYPALFEILGFNGIKAIGISSVPDGTGFFRNSAFFYTPGERHGLLAGFGGKPGAFTHLHLAPLDTDLYAESEFDVAILYRTIKDVAGKIGGETAQNSIDDALTKAGEAAAISFLRLFQEMKGHGSIVMRFDAEKTIALPGPGALTLPAFSWLICVEGVGQSVEPALIKSPVFAASAAGSTHYYEFKQPLPLEGLKPVIAIDGNTLYFATTAEFLKTCREQTTHLGQSPAFQEALAHVGKEGNGVSFVTPRFMSRLRDLEKMNAGAAPQLKSTLHLVTSRLPVADRPLVSVRTNLADGILVRSYMNRSLKQEMVMAAVYNPVSVGLLAAMAIPAFQKVRVSSQEKAVLNNLRQLSAAADQFYLENGVATATYDDLVGPTRYVRNLQIVAGENYRQVRFFQGQPLQVRLGDGRVIKLPTR